MRGSSRTRRMSADQGSPLSIAPRKQAGPDQQDKQQLNIGTQQWPRGRSVSGRRYKGKDDPGTIRPGPTRAKYAPARTRKPAIAARWPTTCWPTWPTASASNCGRKSRPRQPAGSVRIVTAVAGDVYAAQLSRRNQAGVGGPCATAGRVAGHAGRLRVGGRTRADQGRGHA